MTFISLFSNEHGFTGTDQRVFSADEMQQLTDALSQAQSLTQSIASQSEQLRLAKQDGYAKGVELGRQAAAKTAQQERQKDLAQLHARYLTGMEDQQAACVSLALDIVRKIADSVAPEQWLYAEAVKAASELSETSALVLRVPPALYESVQAQAAAKTRSPFERVEKDDALNETEGYIETRYGRIDIDIETQLQHVTSLLNEAVSDASQIPVAAGLEKYANSHAMSGIADTAVSDTEGAG